MFPIKSFFWAKYVSMEKNNEITYWFNSTSEVWRAALSKQNPGRFLLIPCILLRRARHSPLQKSQPQYGSDSHKLTSMERLVLIPDFE